MTDPLAEYTYVVEHSPNCPKPYKVRTITGGFIAYGMSYEACAEHILGQIEWERKKPERERQRDFFRDLMDGL